MQPLFAVYGLCAKGQSRVTDLRFPGRFSYAEELTKMGAEMKVEKNILVINGRKKLKGSHVIARDIRCGAALFLVGLVSDGETIIDHFDQVQRGYEDIVNKFASLGAKIKRIISDN